MEVVAESVAGIDVHQPVRRPIKRILNGYPNLRGTDLLVPVMCHHVRFKSYVNRRV